MFSINKMPNTDVTYADFIRKMHAKRYALHRYQYTWLHKASFEGTIYFRPTFFNYPEEDKAFDNPEGNIMLGNAIKVSPILEDEKTSASFYFPDKNAVWCPLWPGRSTDCLSGGSTQEFTKYYLDEILVHIKSGTIVPLQLGDLSNIPTELNIENLKSVPLDLAILTDKKHSAVGTVIFDDGKTQDLTKYTEFEFRAQGVIPSIIGTEYMDIYVQTDSDQSLDKTSMNQQIDSLVVYNAKQYNFKQNAVGKLTFKDGKEISLATEYNDKTNICRFYREDASTISIRDIDHIHLRAKP
jgi:alpha-glucosidase (family GH31 glycosyl hydrolase)